MSRLLLKPKFHNRVHNICYQGYVTFS